MVFSSYEFIVVFLPIAYFGFLVAGRIGGWELAYAFIGLASVVFYAQFSMIMAVILMASVTGNYLLGNYLISRSADQNRSSLPLLAGVLANLAALGYFKYTNFFIDAVNSVAGTGFSHLSIIAAVGMSFYSFIQIGYLVEAHGGSVKKQTFSRYLVFSTFFPCVTAGPLVLQREIFGQMDDRKDHTFEMRRLAVGLTLFAMGLFKKVVLADAIAPFADVAFNGVAEGQAIGMAEAWMGSLAYMFQLYFDFSGYSDMAVGLGAMFGIRLPLNFNSPFKAQSISDFWRRWHMTMSRFFATYLFNTMAMKAMRSAMKKQLSPNARYLTATAWPLFFTMLIAGIWHGAGWTFVIYGALHGSALAVDHAWGHFKMPALPKPLGWVLTMLVVLTGLIVFRAADVSVAMTMVSSMIGMGALTTANLAGAVSIDPQSAVPYIVVFFIIVLALPNTMQILGNEKISSDEIASEKRWKRLPTWKPDFAWSVMVACVLAFAFTSMSADGSFLYYKF